MTTGNQDGRRTGVGQKAAHDAGDQHHGNDQLPFGFGEPGDDAPYLVGHARFKKGTADDEHGHEQDQVAVHKACKGILGAQYPGKDQHHQGNHGRNRQGKFFSDKQDDDQYQQSQSNGNG